MNTFTKQWLTATCAPESINNIKDINGNQLDCIRNESNTIQVLVVSNNNNVIAIGKTYNELINSKPYTFNEAIRECGRLLELINYSTN